MQDRPLHFPLMNKERLEERLSHIKPADLHDPKTIKLYNNLHSDIGELNRRALVTKYGITLDDFGNYATIEHAGELLMDGIKACTAYFAELNEWLKGPLGGISDDGSDYLCAAADQMTLLAELYAGFDDNSTANRLLAILNKTDEQTWLNPDQNGLYAQAFRYGYADHGSPISDLALFNNEDEI